MNCSEKLLSTLLNNKINRTEKIMLILDFDKSISYIISSLLIRSSVFIS